MTDVTEFYKRFNGWFLKNNIYICKHTTYILGEFFENTALVNQLKSITRTISTKGVTYTWTSQEDLFLIINIMWSSYIEDEDFYFRTIHYNNKIITDLSEVTLNLFLTPNNENKIFVEFTCSDNKKEMLYVYETDNLFFVYFLNDPIKTTYYANLEFIRINKPYWVGLI